MPDQDVVGKVVEMSIECPDGLASLAVGDVLSKDIVIGDLEWTVQCCPRGAPPPGVQGAGDFFSVQFVSRTNASNALVHFLVVVLGRPAPGSAPVAAPPTVFCSSTQRFMEYPSQGQGRKFSSFARGTANSARNCHITTRDLVDMCAVCGHVTIVCGVTVLRHNLTPVPDSTYFTDMQDLREKHLFGEPDVKFVFGGGDDGKRYTLHRRVLSARSPVLKAQLEGSMAESRAAVIRPGDHISVSTFVALVVYLYHDRLPKASELSGGLSVELFRELLAAADWYGIERLKLLCAKKLWDDYMSDNTVCKTLWYARTYNCQKLRKACEEYIAASQNHMYAFSDEFHWLRVNAPDIFDEIRILASNGKKN